MDMFRRLMTVVLIAGTAAGLLLFALQFVTMRPLIQQAETYEQTAHAASAHGMGRVAGLLGLLAPHLLGAPPAIGQSEVPPDLNRQFALLSIATRAVFWLLLGGVGGYLSSTASDRRTEVVRPA